MAAAGGRRALQEPHDRARGRDGQANVGLAPRALPAAAGATQRRRHAEPRVAARMAPSVPARSRRRSRCSSTSRACSSSAAPRSTRQRSPTPTSSCSPRSTWTSRATRSSPSGIRRGSRRCHGRHASAADGTPFAFVTYRAVAGLQLAALADVVSRLDASELEYWLFGGWAVDFYAGRTTRPHFDVDIAVWLDDLPQIDGVLRGSGWRHAPDPDEDGGTGYERDGVRLELTYLVRREDGRVVTPLRELEATWPEDAFGADAARAPRSSRAARGLRRARER